MDKITAHIGKENYRVEIITPSGNVVVSDEPVDKGGKNLGPSPNELLAASLAACTSITVRMYADRKGWELQTLDADVEIERDEAAKKTIITRKIKLTGNLTEEQRTRILAIANACPVHKILTGPIVIDTKLI